MFSILGLLILFVSGVVLFGLSIWLLVEAFSESILWGLVYLFVPFGSWAFIFLNWDRARAPFLYSLGVIPIYLMGMLLASTGM